MTGAASWPSTQASLLLRVRQLDNREAWKTFVDLYGPLIFWFCQQRGLQEADANDVTQEVFHVVVRAIRSFQYDPQRGRFRNWLGAITRTEIRKFVEQKIRAARDGGGKGFGEILKSVEAESEASWIDEFNAHIL